MVAPKKVVDETSTRLLGDYASAVSVGPVTPLKRIVTLATLSWLRWKLGILVIFLIYPEPATFAGAAEPLFSFGAVMVIVCTVRSAGGVAVGFHRKTQLISSYT